MTSKTFGMTKVEAGTLACSPFHVRFGKFSLLQPYEKKVSLFGLVSLHHLRALQVEFMVNHVKQSHAMKLGEGGEAFFVFETYDEIPESLQTSPIVSPATSPQGLVKDIPSSSALQEPDFLDLSTEGGSDRRSNLALRARPNMVDDRRAKSDFGIPMDFNPNSLID